MYALDYCFPSYDLLVLLVFLGIIIIVFSISISQSQYWLLIAKMSRNRKEKSGKLF